MNDKRRWFVEKLLEACQAALQDERIGTQSNHIEKVEVTDRGLEGPIGLRVRCFGDFSADESVREHENQGVFDVMHMVAGYMASRAMNRIDSLDEFKT